MLPQNATLNPLIKIRTKQLKYPQSCNTSISYDPMATITTNNATTITTNNATTILVLLHNL